MEIRLCFAAAEHREIRDWAAVSRPQIYYSLEKLPRLNLVHAMDSTESQGPERRVVATTVRGREALGRALEIPDWAEQRDRRAFLTWMALSWLRSPAWPGRQLERRCKFLQKELQREQATLKSVLEEVGHKFHEAVWMIRLMIAQFETELKWLDKVERELARRGKAKHLPK